MAKRPIVHRSVNHVLQRKTTRRAKHDKHPFLDPLDSSSLTQNSMSGCTNPGTIPLRCRQAEVDGDSSGFGVRIKFRVAERGGSLCIIRRTGEVVQDFAKAWAKVMNLDRAN